MLFFLYENNWFKRLAEEIYTEATLHPKIIKK